MKRLLLIILLFICCIPVFSQKKKLLLKGMYLQWGYNTEWYSNSNIHFKNVINGVNHDFAIYKARAHDRPDLDGIFTKPLEFSVPQFNYRIGFYLNKKHSAALEINFDHTKYIVYDDQLIHAKGTIGNNYFDKDTSFTHDQLHFEHTNGANFYHINYVRQYILKKNAKRTIFTGLWKAGAGVVFPKTDITLSYKRVDNRYHIAGYCISAEGGARWYMGKNIFLEGIVKTGFANYTNALGTGDGRVNHCFTYVELIGMVGYDIKF